LIDQLTDYLFNYHIDIDRGI